MPNLAGIKHPAQTWPASYTELLEIAASLADVFVSVCVFDPGQKLATSVVPGALWGATSPSD